MAVLSMSEYERDQLISNQSDAEEFLLRIINQSENLMTNVGSTIETRMMCKNRHCPSTSLNPTYQEYIYRISEIPNRREISLQEIIDQHLLPDETKDCLYCGTEGKVMRRIDCAPKVMIIQLTRRTQDGTKIKTKIRCRTGIVTIRTNKEKQKSYDVVGVISHKGIETENGHYVYTHFVRNEQKWITVDDHKIYIDDAKRTNEQGSMYILKETISRSTRKEVGMTSTDTEIKAIKPDRLSSGSTASQTQTPKVPGNKTEEE